MGVLAAKFEPKSRRTSSGDNSFLESTAYFEYLQKTHPDLRMSFEAGVPYYVAPLYFYEPLRPGWLKTALRGLAAYWPRFGAPRALFLGSPFEPYEQTALGGKTTALKLSTVQKLARRHGCGLVVLTNQSPQAIGTTAHLKKGFRALPSFPNVQLCLPGKSFDDYLAHQKSKTRNSMLRNLRRFEEAGFTVRRLVPEELKKFSHHLQRSYHHMYARAAVKWLRHTSKYFACLADLADAVIVDGAFDPRGNLVGFVMSFHDGERLHGGRIGVVPSQHRKNGVYFRLIYALIERAYLENKSHLILEPTSYAYKRFLGATCKPLVNLVRGTTPFWGTVMFLGIKFGKFCLRHLESSSWLNENL